MKKILSVFYGFLLFFLCTVFSFQASSEINFFVLDSANKVISPIEISLCGATLICKDNTLESLFEKISQLNNFIGDLASDEIDWTDINYDKRISEFVNLSKTTAWTPTESLTNSMRNILYPLAGKTPEEIYDNYNKSRLDMTNNNPLNTPEMRASRWKNSIEKITPQEIKDKVNQLINIGGYQKISSLDKQSPRNFFANNSNSTTIPSGTTSKPKVVREPISPLSPSAIANEWTFVFKAVYEQLLTAGFIQLANAFSTENKNIGPKAQEILKTSIQNKNTYMEYLQKLFNAVTPVDIPVSEIVVSGPEDIVINKESVRILGKTVKDVFKLVMTEQGEKINLVRNLERNLQPEQVKQDFIVLSAESNYCLSQKNKIKEAITLFTHSFNVGKEMKQPESFGDAWLIKANECKGTSKDITLDATSQLWKNAIDVLKQCFEPKVFVGPGLYRIVPTAAKYSGLDATLYHEEENALAAQALEDKVTSIIKSMQFKTENNKTIKVNVYPSPMEAFNEAWNAVYPIDGQGYKVMMNGSLKKLEDVENVDLVKQGLLKLFAGMNFGNIIKKISGDAQVGTDEQLPEEVILAMKNYIVQNNIIPKQTTMLAVFRNTTNLFPQGWLPIGVNGIQSPSGSIISMDKVIEAVKGSQENSNAQGSLSKSDYELLQIHLKGTNATKDDSPLLAALRAGTTHEDYHKNFTGEQVSQPMGTILVTDYNKMLAQVQAEILKPSMKNKSPMIKFNSIKSFLSKQFDTLGLPKDAGYQDPLVKALINNSSYEDFLNSAEYKQYLKDNKATAAPAGASTPAQVPAKAPESTQAVVSKQLVDKAKYEELAVKMTGISLRHNFTVRSVKMSLGITDESGVANNENQFGLDKDKLAQALFDKKTFDEYVALYGGKPLPAASGSAEKPVTPPVAPKTTTAPAAQKPSTAPGEEKKFLNGPVVSDTKIYDDFIQSIKLSHLLILQATQA